MQEDFIQFVWQNQYFRKVNLSTTEGSSLSIIHPGYLNSDAGPDFSSAKLKIDGLEWVGSVEFHVHSSYWYSHNHEDNKAYDNVILHVVWEHDKDVYRSDKTLIPTLELKDKVDKMLIISSNKLVKSSEVIPCGNSYSSIEDVIKNSMLDRVLMQRLERKANEILNIQELNNNDWEETSYQILARNYGFKVNSLPFYQLSKSIPLKYIKKQRNNQSQVEALLFGQAGLLSDKIEDEYYLMLKSEYHFLSKKYQIQSEAIHQSQWKFLRLRPANFPTIRIAQFAKLLVSIGSVFSHLVHTDDLKVLKNKLKSTPSSYWNSHYQFGKVSTEANRTIGDNSLNNILINTVAPLLVAYGKKMGSQMHIDRAIDLLESIKPESNKITRTWLNLNQKALNASDSQSLIELYNEYCVKRKCLKCSIGMKALNSLQG
jgi:hypothetical protein